MCNKDNMSSKDNMIKYNVIPHHTVSITVKFCGGEQVKFTVGFLFLFFGSWSSTQSCLDIIWTPGRPSPSSINPAPEACDCVLNKEEAADPRVPDSPPGFKTALRRMTF